MYNFSIYKIAFLHFIYVDVAAAQKWNNQFKKKLLAGVNRASQRYPLKAGPKSLAPPPPLAVPEVPAPTNVALMSNHMQTGGDGSRSGVAWPSGTIPARVKKLSWDDDEQKVAFIGSPKLKITMLNIVLISLYSSRFNKKSSQEL